MLPSAASMAATRRPRGGAGDRLVGLAVVAQQLLRAGLDARLARGRARRVAHHARRLHAELLQQVHDVTAGRVVAHDGAEPALRAHRHHVAHHVAGAAERTRFAPHVHHRHRRFGAHALDVAPQVLVEHHVAHDEQAHALEAVHQLLEARELEASAGRHQRVSPRAASSWLAASTVSSADCVRSQASSSRSPSVKATFGR